MTKEEVAYKLAEKALEKFDYKVMDFGGNTITEHVECAFQIAYDLFNKIYKNLEL